MAIECLILGAGQEVGKSCVVVTLNGKKIMFDCGMHLNPTDGNRFPDFSLLSSSPDFNYRDLKSRDFNSLISCVVITHFHSDHVGALPYFMEICGYNGPVYMTYPTKALAPLMLEDYRKIMVGQEEQYSSDDIVNCMKKVIPIDLKQTIQVDKDLQIRAYYAGHVLGAVMVYAKVGENKMVYTGDYNMTPDRHLGAAQIDKLQLDLLITESTYATTIRDTKYSRERDFLKAVHNCVANGGKVLIPTFALGRAQELCILLDDYWERMNLNVPIYFSSGITTQANLYYKMLIGWTSQKIKDSYTVHNPFDFKHVCKFEKHLMHAPGPCVLFATPGFINGGFSLEVFKEWAPSDKNLITLPGYCVAGTVGHKLMSGKPTKIDLDKDTQIDVRCQIHQLAFSPHTDAKGIMDLIEFLSPQNVILVHGEKPKMAVLRERIQNELSIKCFYPANNENLIIPTTHSIKINVTKGFVKNCQKELDSDENVGEGILVMEKGQNAKVVSDKEFIGTFGVEEKVISFAQCICLKNEMNFSETKDIIIRVIERELRNHIKFKKTEVVSDEIKLNSVMIRVCENEDCPFRRKEESNNNKDGVRVYLCCSWSAHDEDLAKKCIFVMKNLESNLILL